MELTTRLAVAAVSLSTSFLMACREGTPLAELGESEFRFHLRGDSHVVSLWTRDCEVPEPQLEVRLAGIGLERTARGGPAGKWCEEAEWAVSGSLDAAAREHLLEATDSSRTRRVTFLQLLQRPVLIPATEGAGAVSPGELAVQLVSEHAWERAERIRFEGDDGTVVEWETGLMELYPWQHLTVRFPEEARGPGRLSVQGTSRIVTCWEGVPCGADTYVRPALDSATLIPFITEPLVVEGRP
jgi:hypothetical protein